MDTKDIGQHVYQLEYRLSEALKRIEKLEQEQAAPQLGWRSVLTGTVTDSATGNALPEVSVSIRSGGLAWDAVTDAAGLYHIAPIPSGLYEMSFRKDGFSSFFRSDITVRHERTVRVNIQLAQVMVRGDEVVHKLAEATATIVAARAMLMSANITVEDGVNGLAKAIESLLSQRGRPW